LSNVIEEGCLKFDFNLCGVAKRYDNKQENPHGMKAVDFVAESQNDLFFIKRFGKFTELSFDLVDAGGLSNYGISCTELP